MASTTTDDLPGDYDCIVLGTGMTECIVAAALSRIGQKVLHLDRNDYYSGDWGTFHFKGIQEWIENQKNPNVNGLKAKDVDVATLLKEGEKTFNLQVNANSVSNVVNHTYIKESSGVIEVERLKFKHNQNEATDETGSNESSEKNNDAEPGKQTEKSICDASNVEDTKDGQTNDQTTQIVEAQKEEDNLSKETANQKDNANEKNGTTSEAKQSVEWSLEKLNKEFRKFNIDLHPRVLFSRGPMVELLISSDIAKYCEFRTITRVLTNLDGKLEQVPCSRSDVFSSKQVSMIEKRMLMKLLTFCLEYEKHPEEYEGFKEKTFIEFLKSKKLTKNVSHYVQHAIAIVPDSASTLEGLKSTQKFLQSLGRYGNTAFLWPLYGSGELPQCFCRMCAVFGGTYCLRRTGAQLVIDGDKQCQGIIDTEGVRLNAKWIVAESSYLTNDFFQAKEKMGKISRGILFTNKSILEDSDEHISLLSIPPDGGDNITSVLELSSSSLACPKDIYMVHLSCKGVQTAEEDFKTVMEFLFKTPDTASKDGDGSDDTKPDVLWSVFFSQNDTSEVGLKDNIPNNLFVLDGPNLDLDFDYCITKAKEVFDSICPGEDFLPKAPNPEDIIFDDGAVASTEGSGFEGAQPSAEEVIQSVQTDENQGIETSKPDKTTRNTDLDGKEADFEKQDEQ